MGIDRERARQYLKSFDFRRLFLDQLGWDKHAGSFEEVVDGSTYRFQRVSEKRGVVALISDSIPDYATRAKLDKLDREGPLRASDRLRGSGSRPPGLAMGAARIR